MQTSMTSLPSASKLSTPFPTSSSAFYQLTATALSRGPTIKIATARTSRSRSGAPSSSKSVTHYPAQRIKFFTKSNVTTLISTLEAEIRRDLYNPANMAVTAKNRTEFEANVKKLLGPTDFM